MSGWDAAFRFLMEHEGGWGTVKGDLGGRTRYGISSVAHPEIDLDKLTMSQVADFYRVHYWDRIWGDDLPEPVARVVFDRGVMDGPGDAVNDLQLLLGLRVDGAVGPVTLQWLSDYALGPHTVAHVLLQRWAKELAHRCQQSPVKRNALPGWWIRTVDLAFEIGTVYVDVELLEPKEAKTA